LGGRSPGGITTLALRLGRTDTTEVLASAATKFQPRQATQEWQKTPQQG